jgi:hypothetical protein
VLGRNTHPDCSSIFQSERLIVDELVGIERPLGQLQTSGINNNPLTPSIVTLSLRLAALFLEFTRYFHSEADKHLHPALR